MVKKSGRSKDISYLRTANLRNQPFSIKRLVKDYQQIENQKIPTVGVVAKPLNNIFVWHANIRGPQSTPYQGGVFHLQIKIPQTYPHAPPFITAMTNIPHPNIFDSQICLDIITPSRGQIGSGWTSAFSIQSILIQLQSFLYQHAITLNNYTTEKKQAQIFQIKKAIMEANDYKCTNKQCKHEGRLSAWPSFSPKQTQEQSFRTFQDQNQIYQKQLICYHTKLTYKDNQLGFGLKISKIPKSGAIKQGEIFYDFISAKAFLKECIKWSSRNEKLTHWIPVYLGQIDNDQKFYKFATHSLSMIMTNSTRNFKPEFVLQVFPKIILTIIYYIIDQKQHPSIRLIRILCHIHAQYLYFIEKFPELKNKINIQIEQFKSSQISRHKNNLPNLGILIILMYCCTKHKLSEIIEEYFQQQLDRQILWIIKQLPQLIQDIEKNIKLTEEQINVSFKSQITSFQIFCFHKFFLTEICEKSSSAKLLQNYQKNLCKLPNKTENWIQEKIKQIFKEVTNYKNYFRYLGLKQRNNLEMDNLLKKAVKSSIAKKYHGQFQIIHQLPQQKQQLKKVLDNLPKLKDFFKIQKQQKNKKFFYKIQQIKKSDYDYKQACIDRWQWINNIFQKNKNVSAKIISNKAILCLEEQQLKNDELYSKIQQTFCISKTEAVKKIKFPQQGWKELFVRLDLEQAIRKLNTNPDFEQLYQKMQVFKKLKLKILNIILNKDSNLKSGYYFITLLLSKLTSISYLIITGQNLHKRNRFQITKKISNAYSKGISNFKNAGANLQFIRFANFNIHSQNTQSICDSLIQSMSEFKLISIEIVKCKIIATSSIAKKFSNILAKQINLRQLQLDDTEINNSFMKDISDSFMRIKSIENIIILNHMYIGNSLSSVIYNLAFSPNLLYLNISRNYLYLNQAKQINVSLYKLLSINSSIQIIDCSYMSCLCAALSKQFYVALGDSNSLQYLNLNQCGLITNPIEFGSAIAFNAKRKGKLKQVNIRRCLSTENILNLYEFMNISAYNEEITYGDASKAQKMQNDDFKKVYYNNLINLQFSGIHLDTNFNLSSWNKTYNKEQPNLVKLFSRSKNLNNLQLENCNLGKAEAQILLLSLDLSLQFHISKIQVLNLRNNKLGKQGCKIIAQIFNRKNVLQTLDISKNCIGVSGCKQLSKSLKKSTIIKNLNLFNNGISYDGVYAFATQTLKINSSLQFIQLGFNRIRNKGLLKIGQALQSNKSNKIKILGLRFNFFTESGIKRFMNIVIDSNHCKLQKLYIKYNDIDELGMHKVKKLSDQKNAILRIDLLQRLNVINYQQFLQTSKQQRTIWIRPVTSTAQQIAFYFQTTMKIGVVTDVRIRNGIKYPNKSKINQFAFVQFAHQGAVLRALHMASMMKLSIIQKILKVYKAGTGTFIYQKKSEKQKKKEQCRKIGFIVPVNNVKTIQNVSTNKSQGKKNKK